MEKKTVTIPPSLIRSLVFGLLIGIATVFVVHLFGKWFAMPYPPTNQIGLGETRYLSMDSKVKDYSLECAFDEAHFFDGNGATFDDIIGGHFSSVKLFGCLSATFEKHWYNILFIGVIAAGLLFVLSKVKFKIGNNQQNQMTSISDFARGDIILGRKGSDAIHPIVYLRPKDEDFFIGAMITKSDKFSSNIPMRQDHFKEYDENGVKFELSYNNSHLVKAKLIKRNEWQPFRKVGKLTDAGVSFIETNTDTKEEQLWEDFLKG